MQRDEEEINRVHSKEIRDWITYHCKESSNIRIIEHHVGTTYLENCEVYIATFAAKGKVHQRYFWVDMNSGEIVAHSKWQHGG